MGRSRIPDTIPEFNTYMVTAIVYLITVPSGGTLSYGEMLGLTSGEVASLAAQLLLWRSNPVGTGIYDVYVDPDTRNHLKIVAVEESMHDFRIWFNPRLIRMDGSDDITASQRTLLHIALPGNTPCHHNTPIEQTVVPGVINMGDGMMKFKCKASDTAKRASIVEFADCVQIAYVLSDDGETFPAINNNIFFSSSKAIFVLNLGSEVVGKYMKFKIRYGNIKNPAINGAWSNPQVILVG